MKGDKRNTFAIERKFISKIGVVVEFLMLDLSVKKYFLFDLDGTLVDLEQLNFACFRDEIKRAVDKNLSFSEYMKHIAGVGSYRGFSSYFTSVGVHDYSIKDSVKNYRKQKENQLTSHFEEVVTVRPGTEEFLKKAIRLGKKLAVGTSTAELFATLILQKAGLRNYFDSVVTVDEVQHTKPSPEIFLEALKRLGGTRAEAVIFEDSANGVKSAENSGIDFVVMHNPGKNDGVVAQYKDVASTFSELVPLLR